MYQIRLKKSDDAVLTLDMPEHIEEVDLSPAVMFNVNYEKLHEFNVKIAEAEEEEDEEFEVDRVEELMLMVDCVAAYFDLKPEVFDEVFSGIGDDDFDTDGAIDSINKILKALSIVFAQYKFTTPTEVNPYSFVHKEVKFIFPPYLIDFLGELQVPKLSVSQSIECLEVKRKMDELKKKRLENGLFSEKIQLLALIARKEGESFPKTQTGIDRLFKERSLFFKDIKMKPGYDAAFFLISSGIL